MVEWLLGLGGTFLILLVMVDVVWSTLSASGGGPLTDWLGGHLWRLARRGHRRFQNHNLLQAAGVVNLLIIVATWIVLVYVGWFLIFSIDPNAIIETETKLAASISDRVYYVGFSLFSLGTGDFNAIGEIWRLLTVLACINGLSVLTLSITYLIPIISAVTTQRQLAEMINALGSDPVEIVENAWNGEDFESLERTLPGLNSLIMQIAQRHLAYPVLHFFHSPQSSSSVGVAVARLDDATTILRHGIDTTLRPDDRIVRSTRHAIKIYMTRISSAVLDTPDDVPPRPDVDPLRQNGVPLRSEEQIDLAFEERCEHRKRLMMMVEVDGWRWDEVCKYNPS
jgi:hypothetical protein